jgi:hypothetical protein
MKKEWNNPDTELTFEEAVQYVMETYNFDEEKALRCIEEHFKMREGLGNN